MRRYSDYLALFNQASQARQVYSAEEIRAAWLDGVYPDQLAEMNDCLCGEIDLQLAECGAA